MSTPRPLSQIVARLNGRQLQALALGDRALWPKIMAGAGKLSPEDKEARWETAQKIAADDIAAEATRSAKRRTKRTIEQYERRKQPLYVEAYGKIVKV